MCAGRCWPIEFLVPKGIRVLLAQCPGAWHCQGGRWSPAPGPGGCDHALCCWEHHSRCAQCPSGSVAPRQCGKQELFWTWGLLAKPSCPQRMGQGGLCGWGGVKCSGVGLEWVCVLLGGCSPCNYPSLFPNYPRLPLLPRAQGSWLGCRARGVSGYLV